MWQGVIRNVASTGRHHPILRIARNTPSAGIVVHIDAGTRAVIGMDPQGRMFCAHLHAVSHIGPRDAALCPRSRHLKREGDGLVHRVHAALARAAARPSSPSV